MTPPPVAMPPDPAFPASLSRWIPAVETALRAAIPTDSPGLAAAARYVLGWEGPAGEPSSAAGKRIRPALCLEAASALGADPTVALPGAVAVELVHNFSLVHDEVQDHDAERHHRPTLWARLGEAQAINAGDYLYTRAIAALANGGADATTQGAALAVLSRAAEAMIAGQWSDLEFETRDAVSVDAYLAMVAGKTGSLLGAPLEIGAILAGASKETAVAFGRWGLHIGLAFQAQDDYLGIWGDPTETGKSNVNDLARRKKTLPVVFGLQDGKCARAIQQAYSASEVGLAS
ncbi:MAG: polyprenyl synthetase family protein, partial [Tepidiformaceae bacterium]